MSNTLTIRRRIKSVGNVRQITKAMQLTAAAKMQKAISAVLGARPYAAKALNLVQSLELRGAGSHPLLNVRPIKKQLLIVISTDKGLVGGLNNQLVKAVVQYSKQSSYPTDLVIVGKKGTSMLAKFGLSVIGSYTEIPSNPTPAYSRPISRFAGDEFLRINYDVVNVVYNYFQSTLVQKPNFIQLLPFIPHPDIKTANDPRSEISQVAESIFEPSPAEVLDGILPRLVDQLLYQIMLEAAASQHASQMVAMQNATDNAGDILDDLQLTYNSIRQSSITAEMAEISASMGAMES